MEFGRVQHLEKRMEYAVEEIISLSEIGDNADHDGDWFETASLPGIQVKFKLDSGSQCNVLSKGIVYKTKAQINPSTTRQPSAVDMPTKKGTIYNKRASEERTGQYG
ncbi:hypothetical protein CBL_20359 [Carabus blaptoides fortunei]